MANDIRGGAGRVSGDYGGSETPASAKPLTPATVPAQPQLPKGPVSKKEAGTSKLQVAKFKAEQQVANLAAAQALLDNDLARFAEIAKSYPPLDPDAVVSEYQASLLGLVADEVRQDDSAAKYLRSKGDPNKPGPDNGASPLHIAAKTGNVEKFRIILGEVLEAAKLSADPHPLKAKS